MGKNPLEEWSSSHGQQKSLKCRTWVESQKWQDDLSTLPRQTFNIAIIQVYVPATNAEEAEVKWFFEDLQDLLELTENKRCPFHCRGLE